MNETNKKSATEKQRSSLRSSYQFFRTRWGITFQEMTPQERRATLEQLFMPSGESAMQYYRRFTVLLMLSALIAFCGLHASSTAVVIGAMLVAPLMEPILAAAAAMVMDWRARLLRAAGLVLWGSLVTILFSAILGLAVPDRVVVVPEILARTQPTLLDLGVAIGAGLAGAYTLVKRVSGAAPGVAVAVALVPPLVVVGICIDEGRWTMAGGAFLLFATNFLAIVLSASVVFLVSGFAPAAVMKRSGRRITAGISSTLVGVVIIALPLTIYTSVMFEKNLIRAAVVDSVDEWSGFLTQDILRIGLQDGQIVVDLAGEMPPPALPALANNIASQVGQDVSLQIRWVPLTEHGVEGKFLGKTKEIRRFRPRSFEQLY